MKGVLEAAAPGLRAEFHATQALLKSVAEGATADVVILTAEGIEQLAAAGKLLSATRLDLGRSGVGLAVRKGAPKPRIGSLQELKETLLAAASVAHSKQGASGIYFAGLLERLQLTEKLKKRIIRIISQHTGRSEDQVRIDSDRDYYMSAEEAKGYGLVDDVIKSRKEIKLLDGSTPPDGRLVDVPEVVLSRKG